MKISLLFVKSEAIKIHIGYLSLVLAVVPLIIAFKSLSVVFGQSSYIFFLLAFSSLFLGLFSFSKWQGKLSVVLFIYFAYRILSDPVCLIYA